MASIIILFTTGLGLIIVSIVKSESAAARIGVAIVLINYFLGIAFPYRELPDFLRPMVHVNPVCIGNNMIAIGRTCGALGLYWREEHSLPLVPIGMKQLIHY